MKKYIKQTTAIFATSLMLLFSGCETIDTDLTEDPSNQGPDDAPLDFLFNNTQLAFGNFFQNTQFIVSQGVRMELMGTSPIYANHYSPTSFDGIWTTAYASFLNDAQLVKQIAGEINDGEITGNDYIAATQIMEAYIIVTLADIFGDIPYTEALQGSGNFNPNRDDDEEIYSIAFDLLDNSISLIEQEGSVAITNDLFYGANMDQWKKLANTLKLKLAVQSRLNNDNSASIANAVIASGEYINSTNDDFQFDYSQINEAPDSRHPLFVSQYNGVAGIYMALPYIEIMEGDPRYNYYFYEQSGSVFARQHGDDGPPVASDFNNITVHGLYPVGGKYNDGTTGATNANMGAEGAGAGIILTSSFSQFMIAETQLMMNGNVGAARTALEQGVRNSIDKVMNFQSSAIPGGADTPSAQDVNDYVNNVLAAFDAPGNNENKLDVIITEYYKALWGNGIEAYNNYRRTSYPSNLPPSVGPSGSFVYSMFYPDVHVVNNTNAEQKESVAQKVWWAEGTNFNLDF